MKKKKNKSLEEMMNQISDENNNVDQEWLGQDDSIDIENLIKRTESEKFEFLFTAKEIRNINR